MNRDYTQVGVLMGGLSAERDISFKTGKGVAAALRERGWKGVIEIPIDRNADRVIREAKINVAWIALHGKFGEDGCIQGLLEMMGIPYTGSGVQASAIAMDKVVTKDMLKPRGMPMAKHELYMGGSVDSLHESFGRYLLVVKPRSMGSSLGVTITHNYDELIAATSKAWGNGKLGGVFVEEHIEGDEITVPVLNGLALPVVRILKDGVFDFKKKYDDEHGDTTYECPAKISAKAAEEAQHLAMVAYHNLGCRGLARVDFIVRTNGQPVFLEINTIPGMTATSLSPLSAAAQGMTYPELCEQILLSATCEQEEPARTE